MTNPTEEKFLKDVEKHEMTVLLDQGIYRHLQFRWPNSYNMSFSIVTFPGYLTYVGDMGSFTFSRLPDMLEFFRDKRPGLNINRSYWGEKLEAVDRNGYESGYLVYSPEKMRETIEDHIKEWILECDVPYDCDEADEAAARKEFEEALREAVDEELLPYVDESEDDARTVVRDYSFEWKGRKYEFQDSWEWNTQDYTFRFTWCCYAIAWAIQKYDARPAA